VILTNVELENIRNYTSLDFSPAPGLNVFLGNNAQGKSNLLEAIALLGTGKSFRTSHESELIRSGQSRAIVMGKAQMAAGTMRLSCELTACNRGTRKAYLVNGEPVRYLSFLGRARIVTFTPASLQLIDGAPSLRRSFMNAALSQESPRYYHALSMYTRALAQKNALLRAFAADEQLLETYDDRLLEFGTTLLAERGRYVISLARAAQEAADTWGDTAREGRLNVLYCPNVALESFREDDVRHAFSEKLRAYRGAEAARGQALVGPHRDDMLFTLGGCSLAAFGSQGQRRTAVLALKFAEYTVMRDRAGEAPLLLLDDVLSELDAIRQAKFLEGLHAGGQVFITSADEIPQGRVAAAYRIEAAALTKL
jgi:DNA replication and repair protein RecF